jgi:hypothetical protein
LISKSTLESQATEAMIFWAGFQGCRRRRLFFKAETKPGHGVEQEIADIIRSIRIG